MGGKGVEVFKGQMGTCPLRREISPKALKISP